MNAELVSAVTFLLLIGAIATGMQFSEKKLSTETKETIKFETGLVATPSALVLGLLVGSAKRSYDAVRNEVIDVSSKIVFLDRLLVSDGPEASDARARLRVWAEKTINRMWPAAGRTADLTPNSEEA